MLCSWHVWGAQFIITLGKGPTGFSRANFSFLVIVSVSKVSIETPLSGGQIPSFNMARSEPAAQSTDLHKTPNYLKLKPNFHPLSSQTSSTRIRARVLFICFIPQRRCIFSKIAYLDIFFNEYSYVNDTELFSDLHYRPWWYMKESARFDMWGKMSSQGKDLSKDSSYTTLAASNANVRVWKPKNATSSVCFPVCISAALYLITWLLFVTGVLRVPEHFSTQ